MEYLLSVVSVCVLAMLVTHLFKSSTTANVIRLISGLLILLVVVAPLSGADLSELAELIKPHDTQMLDDAKENAHERFAAQVAKSTELHIEQIALGFGFEVKASVSVSQDELPKPIRVQIIGTPPPEGMKKLSEYIENNLAVPRDSQTWRSYEAVP